MQPDPVIFRDLAYVFVAAVLGATVAWLARQPLILGYVASPDSVLRDGDQVRVFGLGQQIYSMRLEAETA